MGYIIGGVVFVLGVIAIAFLLSGRGGRSARGRVAPAGAVPVERSEPAADEPTPAASRIAGEGTAQRAQERTPPA